MEPVIATIVASRCGDRRCWAGHVRVPGRPVLVLPEVPTRDAAVSAVRRRWPEAEIVDLPMFEQSREVWANAAPAPVPVTPPPGRRHWYTRWRMKRD